MNPPYKVIYSERVRNDLKGLCSRAAQKGLGKTVLAAIRTIDDRLHRDPRVYGEPKYRYRALKLELRVGIEPPLVVRFTVHEELPLVFVREFQALPGQSF